MMVASENLGLAGATVCAVNTSRGLLATNVETARTILDRRAGLLGRDHLAVGQGLHIVPCDGIHTIGMKFSIDVAFLDENGIVLAIYKELQPGLAAVRCFRAASALELPAGVIRATGTYPGDVIRFQEATC